MEYRFEKTSTEPEKLKQYSELLSAVFPETNKYTVAFLDWQYRQNPSGHVVGFDAYFGEKLIAHYVALPLEFLYKNEPVKGILALNVATHIAHRGKSLFTKLADMTFNYGAELGYKFATGVANQNTSNGYIKRLGFKILAPLDVKIFFGKPQLNKPQVNFFREHWSEEKLKWRLNNPEAKYHSNNGCLSCPTHIKLIDAILSEREEFKNRGLAQKNSLLKMSIGLNLNNTKRTLAISLPEKLKPSPLNLIFKTLGDFKAEVDKSNVFFELIDFDAY